MLSQFNAFFAAAAASFRENPLRVAAILCGFLVALVYVGMPAEELTFDSAYVIGQDVRLQNHDIGSLIGIFSKNYWWPSLESNLYRPLTTLGFWFEYCFLGYGESPLGYQITNALLHWANALLVFILAKKIGVSRGGALLAAAIYAVHPIATEAVANIVGRSDLLAGLSVFGGMICYLTALERSDWRQRLRWLIASGACGLAGVLAKESAIVLPALVAWHGLLRSAELKTSAETKALWLRDAGWSALLFVPSAIVFFTARIILSQSPGVSDHPFIDNPLMIEGFWISKITAFAVWGQQLAALFNPTGLSSDYSFNAIPVAGLMFGNTTAIVGWITLLGFCLFFAFLYIARKKLADGPLYLAGAYVIAMLPTSNLLIKIGSIRADRFHYLPSALFWIFLFLVAERLSASVPAGRTTAGRRGGARMLVLGWVFCMAVIAHMRCYDWHSNLNLWRSAYATTPGSGKVQAALGNEMVRVLHDEPSLRAGLASSEGVLDLYVRMKVPREYWSYMMFSDIGSFSVSLFDKMSETPGREAEAKAVLEEAVAWLEKGFEAESATRHRWARLWMNNDLAGASLYEMMHRNYVLVLQRQKRWVDAADELGRLLNRMPFKVELRELEAQNLQGQGHALEALDAWTLLALMEPGKTYYIKDLSTAILEVEKSAKPLVPNETGLLRLNLDDATLIASLRRSWKTYDALLASRGKELERKQLMRSIRYHYGIKGDLS